MWFGNQKKCSLCLCILNIQLDIGLYSDSSICVHQVAVFTMQDAGTVDYGPHQLDGLTQ